MLKLRPIRWHDGATSGKPDYSVIDERGTSIGRIQLVGGIGGTDDWHWTIYGLAISDPWVSHRHAGREPTREAAMAAFRAAWQASTPRPQTR